MDKKTKKKSFHYKAIKIEGAATFQTLLTRALDRAKIIKDRQQPLDKSGEQVRFITLTRPHKGMLCGVVATYTKGQNQAVVSINENAAEVPLEQIAPPKNQQGQRTEFVEGTAYFAIQGNRLILLQSIALKAKQLEDYFNWLLQRGLTENHRPPLASIVDVPKPDLRKQRVKGVKAITIKPPLNFETHTEPAASNNKQAVVLEGKGLGFKWLNFAMNDLHEGFSDTFAFRDALETGDIEVRLEVIYHKRGKDEGRVMLDDIAAALTHVDVPYEMDVPGYGKVSSDQLKIHDEFTVEAPGGLPLATDVFRKMGEWLESLLTSGMV